MPISSRSRRPVIVGRVHAPTIVSADRGRGIVHQDERADDVGGERRRPAVVHAIRQLTDGRRGAPRPDGAGMTDVEIRDARGGELVAGCALLATSLGFGPRDALPPWLVQTAAASGGIALGAFREAALIGFSVAIPAEPDALFSCGLAVDPGTPRPGRRTPAQARAARARARRGPHASSAGRRSRSRPRRSGSTSPGWARGSSTTEPGSMPTCGRRISRRTTSRSSGGSPASRAAPAGPRRRSRCRSTIAGSAAGELGDWRMRVRRRDVAGARARQRRDRRRARPRVAPGLGAVLGGATVSAALSITVDVDGAAGLPGGGAGYEHRLSSWSERTYGITRGLRAHPRRARRVRRCGDVLRPRRSRPSAIRASSRRWPRRGTRSGTTASRTGDPTSWTHGRSGATSSTASARSRP